MLLAADVGATKAYVGLFREGGERPAPVATDAFPTRQYASLDALLDAFLQRVAPRPKIAAACAAVAGAVIEDRAALTNVGWIVDGRETAARLGIERFRLLNDLVAVAYAIEVLEPRELHTLQDGEPNASGNAGLIAAGTGLGQSFLFNDGRQLVPAPSEGGHADFASRTPREWALTWWLTERYGRADVEQVVSGIGLTNLYHFTHPQPCASAEAADLPALLSRNALQGTCDRCRAALDIFIEAYGAEAGNLALRCVATRGLFIGGGIAPKILPALETGAFMRAFTEKPPMRGFLLTVPVRVILNPQAGLLGAATVANRLAAA
ncbi:MAG TPA: glucokinase [Vicinamibacterales bacterium]|nr:glucokinase [Vicinamibacterales bacterium]